jgi:hypothetical protein
VLIRDECGVGEAWLGLERRERGTSFVWKRMGRRLGGVEAWYVLDWTGQRVGADVRLFEGVEGEIK